MIRIPPAVGAAAVLLAVAATGCTPPPPATSTAPTTPAPSATRSQACTDAAAALADAVARVVASYDTPEAGASVSPSATGTSSGTVSPSATPSVATGSDDLTAAVEAARTAITRNGCSSTTFTTDLQRSLAAIRPHGPIATAVLARVSATLTGKASQTTVTRTLGPGDDLAQAIAESGAGSTLQLQAGTYQLTAPLVLLDAVVLKGAGADRTIVRATTPDAAVLVVTGGRVELRDLALQLDPHTPASGVLGGPTSRLVLSGVRISGARAASTGAGGAGVQLSGGATGASPAPTTGTTLEVTDSRFDDNAWAGIAVAGTHQVSILRAEFGHNGQCGACFLDASTGSVQDSTFTGNLVGLGATGSSRPTWLSDTVTGGTVGVQVDGTAAPTIDRITVSGSTRAAIIFSHTSAGAITHATCTNVPYGIVVATTATPTLGDNACKVASGG